MHKVYLFIITWREERARESEAETEIPSAGSFSERPSWSSGVEASSQKLLWVPMRNHHPTASRLTNCIISCSGNGH